MIFIQKVLGMFNNEWILSLLVGLMLLLAYLLRGGFTGAAVTSDISQGTFPNWVIGFIVVFFLLIVQWFFIPEK